MDINLKLNQTQIMSQKMMLSAKILQMSSIELCDYIKDLSIENPVVEFEDNTKVKIEVKKEDFTKSYKRKLESIDNEEKDDNWKFKDQTPQTLTACLLDQLRFVNTTKKENLICKYLIENLDSKGYLDDKIEDIALRLNVEIFEVENALMLIQTFEPFGIGARNLSECLLLQLTKMEAVNQLAIKIVDNNLLLLSKNRLDLIAKKHKVLLSDVVEAVKLIKNLNPKPGTSFATQKNIDYIIPDVIIKKNNDVYEIICDEKYSPKIVINHSYKEMIAQIDLCDKETQKYIKTKQKQAEWVNECVQKRNSTLLKVVKIIVQKQTEFFEKGIIALKPLNIDDVAKEIELHISTVSRAIKNKFVQCDKGVFAISEFFPNGFSKSTSYELEQSFEACDQTPQKVKNQIFEIIQCENKNRPLSDRVIAEMILEEGFTVSRRTVAKYREALGLPSANGRKSFVG